MRVVFRGIILLFAGLVVAVVVYPVLHECGHAFFAFVAGVKVEEINLFSEFSVICSVDKTESAEAVFVGYGGIIIPVIFSCLFVSDIFILRYMNFVLKAINLISLAYSGCAAVLFFLDVPVYQNDVTTMLSISSDSIFFTVVIIIVCTGAVVHSIIRSKLSDDLLRFYFNFSD